MAADMIGKVPPPAAVAALMERVTAGSADATELLTVIRALARAGLLDHDDAYGELRQPPVAAIGPAPHGDPTLGSTGGEDDGDRDRGGGAYGPREQP